MATAEAQAPLEAPSGPIYVDTQHEDLVHDVQMDYYGAKLATCSSGKHSCLLGIVLACKASGAASICTLEEMMMLCVAYSQSGDSLLHFQF